MSDMMFPTTAEKVAQYLGGEILGDPDRKIESLATLDLPRPESLLFIAEKKYVPRLEKTCGATLLSTAELAIGGQDNTFVIVQNPKHAFARVAASFMPKIPWQGISSLASIHPKAKLEIGVSVGPFAVISEGAHIAKGTVIFPYAYVGPGVSIGENCEVHPHVSLVANITIANRVKIFAGAVIGSEGFGFLEQEGAHLAIPQVGKVVIEDDVRIGANCTIDRAFLGETRIGAGTKLDDQVHVGHNSIIGKNCILCGQAVLGGSTVLEEGVILGGQVALSGHLTVGKGASLAGQSGANADLKGGERYFGSPAMPIKKAFRILRATSKLPEILVRLKQIETQLKGTS